MKTLLTKHKFSIFFLLVFIIALSLSGFMKISYNQNYIQIGFNQKIPENDALISQLLPLDPIDKTILDKKFDKYLEEKNNNADRWLTYMSILSTIFAVFFVYSGFKINDNVEKYENILKQLEKHKKKWDQEHQLMQLLYKVTYWRMKSEYENALDLLDDILRKDFVEIDNDKKYIVYKEIADTHYQMGESSEKSKENSANYQNAITYLERAIKLKPDNEDNDIFLRELKNKYNEMDNLTTAE